MLSQDEEALLSEKATGKHIVGMLPTLDPYLMGYKDRERYMNPEHRDYIFDRGGNATSTILLNGKVIGIWDFKEPVVKIFFFENPEADLLKEVSVQARSLGDFISGKDAEVKECESIINRALMEGRFSLLP
jgi:hypothetical protein